MTIQQEATNLIYSMPEENVRLIVEMMRKMVVPVSKSATNSPVIPKSVTVSNRIGLGKGIVNDPDSFDNWDAEVADLFEETEV